ncbi:hypothetical protein [Jiangella sp. DSM 45060]|uniref:hypothetical protein n=1 Tax=Jiangella sp. DSM 45060 TaxID=1798224 RepID=UPI0012FD5C7A|nr:hypothetical protein [Jiangella sp. DSM 45060]
MHPGSTVAPGTSPASASTVRRWWNGFSGSAGSNPSGAVSPASARVGHAAQRVAGQQPRDDLRRGARRREGGRRPGVDGGIARRRGPGEQQPGDRVRTASASPHRR